MSVAFRRESDEEHLEPKFDRPIPAGPNLVTPRGLAMLEAEAQAIDALLAATPVGERAMLERDRRYWRARLATAQPAPAPAEGEIGIGSHVRYRLGGKDMSVQIVGIDEADPEAGRIGFSAPLARTLLGGGEGDMLAYLGQMDAIEVIAVGDIDR